MTAPVGRLVAEAALPDELSPFAAVDAAFPRELAQCHDALRRRLPVLVECEKELAPYVYRSVRERLKADGTRCLYLDGRPAKDLPPPPQGAGLVAAMIHQLREVVRGAVGERIVVLPHLDIMSAGGGPGALGAEAREVIPLLYENPEVLWLGFRDPAFPLPAPIENLFPARAAMLGVPRDRLPSLVTQREARKLGRGFDPYALYKLVSGVNAIRLRRLLSALTGEDYPDDPAPAFAQLRAATLSHQVELPDVDLERDIGGYGPVKERLNAEILAILAVKDRLGDPAQIERIEQLIPRGMIFWGPPGTGKTLFAKAMATALDAAVTIVSGPELKSKWYGESEQNLRAVFANARQSAPAVIVFDELDSYAGARGRQDSGAAGADHSLVNQLLTEMDGFRSEELVFVVGTTNFVESLDPALLRPGRFEFALHIPYPNEEDRRAILRVHDAALGTQLSADALEYAVKRTDDLVPGPGGGVRYSGDHLQALCRQLARTRLREAQTGLSAPADVERAIEQYLDRPRLTTAEERVVATHEAGHAVVALACPSAPPIDRISIRGDLGGSLGYVKHADPAHKYVVTVAELRDTICTLFGGREAEALLLNDLSIGGESDFAHATQIARGLVERFGGGDDVGVGRWAHDHAAPMSEATRARIDGEVRAVLEAERLRARRVLDEHRALLVALRDLLIEKKVLDRSSFAHLSAEIEAREADHG